MMLPYPIRRLLPGPRLRVLMYHRIQPTTQDGLTLRTDTLADQLAWLIVQGFQFVTGSHVVAHLRQGASLPPRPVLVTFDDAYTDLVEHALPILRKYQVPAVVFVPTAHVGGANAWDDGRYPILSAIALQTLPGYGIELAYHSHHHLNYRELRADAVRNDLRLMIQAAKDMQLPCLPLLAYPYGAYPKQAGPFQNLVAALTAAGMVGACRIGNRHNPLPLVDPYRIQRLDIRGDESFTDFARKVLQGKLF